MLRKPSFPVATRDALRTYWASAALILGAGAVALAAVVPVFRLTQSVNGFAPRLRYGTVRLSSLGFQWGSNAATPADAQVQTIDLLFQLMLVAAFATLILAAMSILSISAARASARFPEIAVRRAVGASRRSLLAAALAEGGALGVGALVLGIIAGSAGFLAALAGWPGHVSPGSAGPGAVALLAVAMVILVGCLFQLFGAPSRRIAEPNPQPVELYIPALQLGMGLTVLVASTMLGRHAADLVRVEEATENGTVLQLSSQIHTPSSRAAQYHTLLASLESDPSIKSASLMSPGALVGLGMTDAITTDCGYCADGGLVIKWHVVFTTHQFVSADTFEALGIERIQGRLLLDTDRWDAEPVAVISETLARRHFQNGEAIGRQILLKLAKPEWHTVVGVVEDRNPTGFGGKIQPRSAIYLSVLQHPPTDVDLLVRPFQVVSTRRIEMAAGNTGVSIVRPPSSERDILTREARPLDWFGRWFSLLGWAMLLITTVSTFVLMRLWVRSLRPELGLRRAVGARRFHLFRYLLVRALLTALAGVVIAIWFGPSLWDSLPEMVAGLQPWSLDLVAPLACILVAIALAGALFPALGASRDTPTTLIGSAGE